MRTVYGFKEDWNKRKCIYYLPGRWFRPHGSFSVVLAVQILTKFTPPIIIANFVQIQMECMDDLSNYGEHAYVHGKAVLPTIYERTCHGVHILEIL